MRVLVVEDNRKHAAFLARVLGANGYAVEVSCTGSEALELARRNAYDVVVLDWNLPGVDGLGICRLLRQGQRTVPVLMLTVRDERDDQVQALEAGADDFLSKPYDLEILLARLRALVRRRASDAAGTLQVGAIVVRASEHSIYVGGTRLALTNKQYSLLDYLARHAGQIVTRDEILANVWGMTSDPGSNVIDVHIRHLRVKLGSARGQLRTARGFGYILSDQPH
jgi:two-component system OmpR family response regulator